MLYVLQHIWPWALGALALGMYTGMFAGQLTAQLWPVKRNDAKKAVKPKPADAPAAAPPASSPEQIQALEKQLAERDAAIADLRAGLDREVALRRAAIARLEGMLVEQQPAPPPRPAKAGNKSSKGSAKSSPSR